MSTVYVPLKGLSIYPIYPFKLFWVKGDLLNMSSVSDTRPKKHFNSFVILMIISTISILVHSMFHQCSTEKLPHIFLINFIKGSKSLISKRQDSSFD